MPVSFLVQDRESCLGMVGSPLHPASEVICKIVRDYVWRRLSSMLLHPNWILKWNNPQEAITKILSTNWILIDPSPGQPKMSRMGWNFPGLTLTLFPLGVTKDLVLQSMRPSCPRVLSYMRGILWHHWVWLDLSFASHVGGAYGWPCLH